MKKITNQLLTIVYTFFAFSVTKVAFAQESTEPSVRLTNPLGGSAGIKTLPDLVKQLLEIVLTIGVPIVALAIIYAGYLFIAAQGSEKKLQEAKDTMLYVLIGSGVLLAAYVIAESIHGTITAISA